MKASNYFRVLLLAFAALVMNACAQESGGDQAAPAASDTAVHDAEVASGDMANVMARGEAVYLSNCAACHQPTGQGLPGAFPPLAQSDFLQGNRQGGHAGGVVWPVRTHYGQWRGLQRRHAEHGIPELIRSSPTR